MGWNIFHISQKGQRPPQSFSDGCKVTIVGTYTIHALCKVGESTYLVDRQFLELEGKK